MPWVITKDYINNGEHDSLNRQGVCSKDCPPPKEWKEKLPDRFRLYDDDGNLSYEGRFDSNDEYPFDVLDWAANDAGCTTLKYQEDGKGKWEIL